MLERLLASELGKREYDEQSMKAHMFYVCDRCTLRKYLRYDVQ